MLGFDLSSNSGPSATIGGLRSQNTGFGLEIAGVYKTTPFKADRSGLPLESLAQDLPKWASEQARFIASLKLPRKDEVTLAFRIQELGGSSEAIEVATIISANGVSHVDEAALQIFFKDRRVVFFAPNSHDHSELLSTTKGEPLILPDGFSELKWSYGEPASRIKGTSAWYILAKAWNYSPSELKDLAAFRYLGPSSHPTGIMIERPAATGSC
jgi:hypothetical protein